jgi:GntP family gluconate:H+ symporter
MQDRAYERDFGGGMTTLIALAGAIAFIVLATARWNVHAYLALLLAALGFGLAAGLAPLEVVAAANQGFGTTIGNIGAVVILGGIIGVFLERSGAALRIAEAVLKLTGQKNVPGAMAGVGYVVSIAVFCDTAFVILSSLNRALSKRAGVTLASGAIALALGLYATHTMVPPTPGPVAAAGILGADLGLVIAIGVVVAALALIPAWLFAATIAARVNIDPDASLQAQSADPARAEGQAGPAPRVAHALTPILAPLLLIVLGSVANLPAKPLGDGALAQTLAFLGIPTIALLLGAALAMTLPRRFTLALIAQESWVGDAIKATAIILIVTGAGGAFAGVLAKTDIGVTLGGLVAGAGAQFGLLIPFAIAALIKTAQGSSTVSMITTAGIALPILPALGLESEVALALTTVAIGAGAMVVSHANDSYFWVVTQFSGMTPRQGFQLHTMGTLIQGASAAALVYSAGLMLL